MAPVRAPAMVPAAAMAPAACTATSVTCTAAVLSHPGVGRPADPAGPVGFGAGPDEIARTWLGDSRRLHQEKRHDARAGYECHHSYAHINLKLLVVKAPPIVMPKSWRLLLDLCQQIFP